MIDLNNMSRKELLDVLSAVKLEYRDQVIDDEDITFGVEIEYVNALRSEVDEILKTHNSWQNKMDFSLSDGESPYNGEVISPILTDNKNTWQELDTILTKLKMLNAGVNELCGAHIHFGSQIMPYDLEVYFYLLKLWSVFEKEIFQFSFGEFETIRNSIITNAIPMRYLCIAKDKDTIDCLNKINRHNKDWTREEKMDTYNEIFKNAICNYSFMALSLTKLKHAKRMPYNTFEVRSPNGTLSKEVWQNNYNFFVHFLKYFNKDFDRELIDYEFKKIDPYDGDYNYYDYDKAISLAERIFDDEFDSISFLKQYSNGDKLAKVKTPLY